MKHRLLVPSVILLALSILAACAPSTPKPATTPATPATTQAATKPAAEAIKLTYVEALVSPTNLKSIAIRDKFLAEIEKRTGGRVKWELIYGTTVFSASDVVKGVSAGLASAATDTFSYHPGVFPINEMGELPFGAGDHGIAAQAWWEMVKTMPEITQQFTKQNIKYLFPFTSDATVFCFRKKITSIDEFKGLRIRAYGPAVNVVVPVGAIPVTVAYGEIYSSLEKGVIDGTYGYFSAAKGERWAEVAKYWFDTHITATGSGTGGVMNLDAFQKLPKDIQKIIEDVGDEMVFRMDETTDKAVEEGKAFINEQKGEISKISPQERKRWEDLAKEPIWQEWRKKMDAAGIPWKKFEDKYFELIKKYGG